MKVHDKFIIEVSEIIKGYFNNPKIEEPFNFIPCDYKFYEIEGIALSEDIVKKMKPLERYESEILNILEHYILRIPPTVYYELKADITNIEGDYDIIAPLSRNATNGDVIKADMAAILTEIQLKIEENSYSENVYGDKYGINKVISTDGIYQIIQQKIDSLKSESEGKYRNNMK